jgi:aromatic-L-amino-acid/L-tryptophan decarboxylase
VSFDPADWSDFRALAHRMVDDMLDHLSSLREQPAWRPMPADVRHALSAEPLPRSGTGEAAAYADFLTRVCPYTNGNLHPRFWGWVQGNGTPLGMMADMLAAGINPHMAGFDQAPALVEHRVIAWLAELLAFPAGASGLIVSGGSMANLLGLAVARHAAGSRSPLVCYGSAETHNWARKAVSLMGLPNGFAPIPVTADDRIDLDALRRAIDARRPFAVIGTAGTVNTGAIDDLVAMADIAREAGVWFHIDGAFGALAALSDTLRPLVAGLDRADSLGFDLHKWGYLPFECACVLVRDAKQMRDTFATSASYLEPATRGVMAGGIPFADRGFELTRGFKALKIWMSFKAYGVDAFARMIEENVEQARYLASLVDAHPLLERLAPVALNVVCFRYVAGDDAVNQEILLRVQETGVAVPSGTKVGGRYAIRCAITNHRTRREDLDAFVDAVVRIGQSITG